eukprot:3529887-Pleurochrysis_carterae.AAC.1
MCAADSQAWPSTNWGRWSRWGDGGASVGWRPYASGDEREGRAALRTTREGTGGAGASRPGCGRWRSAATTRKEAER